MLRKQVHAVPPPVLRRLRYQLVLQSLEAVRQEVRLAGLLGDPVPPAAARLVAPVCLVLRGPVMVLVVL